MLPPNTRRVLCLIPAVYFILSIILVNQIGPYYLGANLDPSYPYLFAALNFLTMHPVTYNDHPGTTVQVITAAIVFCKWVWLALTGPFQSLQRSVLTRPDDYLHTIGFMFYASFAAASYLVAAHVHKRSRSLGVALAFEITLLMFIQPLISCVMLSPEFGLVLGGIGLLFPLSSVLFPDREDLSRKLSPPVIAGIMFAFTMVSKVNAIPLAFVVLLFRNRRQRILFAMTSLAAALVLLLPVITRLPSMARWIWSLLIHNQRYGGGEVGLPSVATMRSNLNAIYGGEPFLFYTVLFFALVYVLLSLVPYRHEEQVQSTRMLLLVAVLANALQIVMTVKHCAPHYIVPALMLTPIVIAGITALLLKSTVLHRSLRAALAVALAALVASGLLYNGYRLRSWSAQFESYRSELARTERAAQAKIEGSDCLRVGYYRSSLPEFALSFGSDLSGRSQGSVLEELYPDAVYYSRGQFYAFPGRPCLEKVVNRVRKGGCVLLQGEALPVGSTVVGFTRETIAAGLHEVIYRLGVGSLASGPVVPQIHLPDGSIVIDALKFTAGNVVRDSTDFGVGLGVIRSSIMPSFAEYEIPIPSAGPYEVAIRYATEELRPVTIRLNGEMSGTSVCTDTTSGYNPANQLWQSAGDFSFKTGANVLRIESAGPFPHISKLAIIPKKNRP